MIPRPKERGASEGTEERLVCANCLVPIRGEVTEREGTIYCCQGCSGGGPCVC